MRLFIRKKEMKTQIQISSFFETFSPSKVRQNENENEKIISCNENCNENSPKERNIMSNGHNL